MAAQSQPKGSSNAHRRAALVSLIAIAACGTEISSGHASWLSSQQLNLLRDGCAMAACCVSLAQHRCHVYCNALLLQAQIILPQLT